MRLWMNEPGLRDSWPGTRLGGATIVRWSEDTRGLALEDCARKGIEALAGLVVFADAFDISGSPDEMFCTCVELYHAATGTDDEFGDYGDYIGVYFRVVEFRDSTYPMVGPRSFKMLMQPLDDGNVCGRWNAVDGSEADESPDGGGPMVDDVSTRIGAGRPLTLGDIPGQDAGDEGFPSFLLLRDPGAGWQIWRRSTARAGSGEQAHREETYTMVYPMLDADFCWRFRVYDVPGGGVRVETSQGNRR